MTGEVATPPVAGEAAGTQPVASGDVTKIPPELKPAVDKYVNDAVASAVKRERQAAEKEMAEREKLARMSDQEKLSAELEKERARAQFLESQVKYSELERRVSRAAQAKGFIPPEILDSLLREAMDGDDDVDVEEVARKAHERFNTYVESVRPSQTRGAAATRTGTPVAMPSGEFGTMTFQQAMEQANAAPTAKQKLVLTKKIIDYQSHGGKFVGE